MPWSEWQDPFPVLVGGSFTMLSWSPSANVVQFSDPVLFSYSGLNAVEGGGISAAGVQWRYNEDWPNVREQMPPAMDALTEDVDYAVRPGYAGWEDDAYVEYADDPNVWTGWTSQNMQGQAYETANPSNAATGTMGMTIDTGYPDTEGADIGPFPGIGTAFATWTSVTMVDIGPIPDPGPVNTFTLAVMPEISAASNVAMVPFFPTPRMVVILPAWRYWMPDTEPLPLRQKQRDDGLGRSVVRARSTHSIQRSVRQRGYR